MVETNTEKLGDVSDWNEGNFKSMRLHEAQRLVNEYKSLPFVRKEGKWGYEIWFTGSDIIFSEGNQKYNATESKELAKLKEDIEFLMKKGVCNTFFNGTRQVVNVNVLLWDVLKKYLEKFEFLARSYNDKHGLSTKNVGTKGLF